MTVDEAKAAGLIELTVPSDGMERIDTQYGNVSVRHWLACEYQRINSHPERTAHVIAHDDGNLSLWVNPVRPQLEAVE